MKEGGLPAQPLRCNSARSGTAGAHSIIRPLPVAMPCHHAGRRHRHLKSPVPTPARNAGGASSF
ncbi:hypothetical protein CBM2587_A120063 [Cupriavidus taiwanensis]|uniref:Uncharacterized protein n=1 Tax=Cupriavidus taiwanensis TaxID=164546 RepID=A0A375BHE4_9BURK|nr:hypothetical protein CBM2587_A120063 [Cupriavidus taiwanensis]